MRRRWSETEKQQAVLDALRSGLPIERFARQNGLTPSALHRWKHKFAQRVGADVSAGAGTDVSPPSRLAPSLSPTTFAAVTITTPPAPASSDAETQRIEIVLNNGRRLHVGLGVDMVALQRLVAALEPAA